jgi:hypothetical protein
MAKVNYRYLCVASELSESKCSLARQACIYHIFDCQQSLFRIKALKMAIKYMINATVFSSQLNKSSYIKKMFDTV